jgi:hypothetical protein
VVLPLQAAAGTLERHRAEHGAFTVERMMGTALVLASLDKGEANQSNQTPHTCGGLWAIELGNNNYHLGSFN